MKNCAIGEPIARDGTLVTNTVARARKRVDSRDWSEYNRWQSVEVVLACMELCALVESSAIHDWSYRTGRPRISRRDVVLCLLVKAYFNVSFRRLVGLLHLLQPVLGLERVPAYTTLGEYNRDPALTNTLERLFRESAKPFWNAERVLSVDSTGLVLQGSGSWRANKRDDAPRDYAKIHVLSGTVSRASLVVRTTRGTWHDSTQLEALLEQVPDESIAVALTGDSAYWTHKLCEATKRRGLQPYFKPKNNARWWTRPKDEFERMTRFALQFPNRFARVYHRRSTSESRNATEKLLFGERLRARRPESRRNEVFARQIVHNVRLLTRGVRN